MEILPSFSWYFSCLKVDSVPCSNDEKNPALGHIVAHNMGDLLQPRVSSLERQASVPSRAFGKLITMCFLTLLLVNYPKQVRTAAH